MTLAGSELIQATWVTGCEGGSLGTEQRQGAGALHGLLHQLLAILRDSANYKVRSAACASVRICADTSTNSHWLHMYRTLHGALQTVGVAV